MGFTRLNMQWLTPFKSRKVFQNKILLGICKNLVAAVISAKFHTRKLVKIKLFYAMFQMFCKKHIGLQL